MKINIGRVSTPIAKAHASGYPLQGRRTFRGLQISVETRKGRYRTDKHHSPPQWKTLMACDYGYIRGTHAVDNDHIDVFVGPNENAPDVFIINQNHPATGAFDEQKVMLGFNDADAAKAMYLRHYDTPKFFGSMQTMRFEEFKAKALATLDAAKSGDKHGTIIKGTILIKGRVRPYRRKDGTAVRGHSRKDRPVIHSTEGGKGKVKEHNTEDDAAKGGTVPVGTLSPNRKRFLIAVIRIMIPAESEMDADPLAPDDGEVLG